MDNYDYKSNSHKSREAQKETVPEKKVEKVISGSAKVRKKSGAKKLANVLISEDVGDVKSYILIDVLLPAVKKAIWDVITNGTDMLLWGGSGHGGKKAPGSKISYGNFFDRGNDRRRDYSSSGKKTGYNYDDVILDSRGEAEGILTSMDDLIEIYGTVSVADLYDLAGVSANHTDNKYGWTDIRNASVIRTRDGYMIKLPRAIVLN